MSVNLSYKLPPNSDSNQLRHREEGTRAIGTGGQGMQKGGVRQCGFGAVSRPYLRQWLSAAYCVPSAPLVFLSLD